MKNLFKSQFQKYAFSPLLENSLLQISLTALIIIFLTQGCQKRQEFSINEESMGSSSIASSSSSYDFYSTIGAFHNDGLDYIFSSGISFDSSNVVSNVSNLSVLFYSNWLDTSLSLSLSQAELDTLENEITNSLNDDASTSSILSELSNYVSPIMISYLNQILTESNSVQSPSDLATFSSGIQTIRSQVENDPNLSFDESSILLGVLGVADSSSHYWNNVAVTPNHPFYSAWGLPYDDADWDVMYGPILDADISGALGGALFAATKGTTGLMFGPGGYAATWVGAVGGFALASSAGPLLGPLISDLV